jgi:hypothetical protein
MNYHESELRKELSRQGISSQNLFVKDSQFFFTELNKYFPSDGSKISWQGLHQRISEQVHQLDGDQRKVASVAFVSRVIQLLGKDTEIFYAGDSATEFLIRCPATDLLKIVPYLFDIPQHHYFSNRNFTWCMCISMEGDLDFGSRQ